MSYILSDHPLYKNNKSNIIISPKTKTFLDKIFESQQLITESECIVFGKPTLEYYRMYSRMMDLGDPTYVELLSKDKYEFETDIYTHYFAKIYDLGNRKFLYLGNCANEYYINKFLVPGNVNTMDSPWIYIVAEDYAFRGYRTENFKIYMTLEEFLEPDESLIGSLNRLNMELPDYLQDNNVFTMIKNIRRHFQHEIGSLSYKEAKHDFELRCIKTGNE